MRASRVVLVAAIGASCAAAVLPTGASAATGTALTITYYEDADRRSERTRWTLRCAPAGGTHPRPAKTCRELARLGWQAFRPAPANRACTEIYGGPQLAIVSGRVAGRAVWARLTRIDGCQIERWDRVPSLLPPGGVR